MNCQGSLKYNAGMGNPEMTPQQAWAIIQEKHRRLAAQDYTLFLETGHLETLEDESNPISVLMQVGKKSAIYDRDRRLFLGTNPQIRLTSRQNMIFTLLLDHPNILQPYGKVYNALFPNDVSNNTPREVVELLRPHMSRLRDVLETVHPDLPNTIETVRGAGYVYLPHSSLQEESSLPPQG